MECSPYCCSLQFIKWLPKHQRYSRDSEPQIWTPIPTHTPSRHISLLCSVFSNFRTHAADSNTSPCSPQMPEWSGLLQAQLTGTSPKTTTALETIIEHTLRGSSNPISRQPFSRAHSYWTRKGSGVRSGSPEQSAGHSTGVKGCSAGRSNAGAPRQQPITISARPRGGKVPVMLQREAEATMGRALF